MYSYINAVILFLVSCYWTWPEPGQQSLPQCGYSAIVQKLFHTFSCWGSKLLKQIQVYTYLFMTICTKKIMTM